MILRHAGLTCSSEENADRFYANLLGLKKSDPKTLPAEISHAIFDIDSELTVINFVSESAHFEIFIHSNNRGNVRPIDHLCLEVNDLSEFLQRCRRLDVNVIQVPKGETRVTFVKDYDGNSFEIKGK